MCDFLRDFRATTIILCCLLYNPMRSDSRTQLTVPWVDNDIAEHVAYFEQRSGMLVDTSIQLKHVDRPVLNEFIYQFVGIDISKSRNTLAYCNVTGNSVYIYLESYIKMSKYMRKALVVHELGHCMACIEHTNSGIMYPYLFPPSDVDFDVFFLIEIPIAIENKNCKFYRPLDF